MTEMAKAQAERTVREAQDAFERQTVKAHAARRKAFERAREAGLTLREIGEQAGLHHTTVGEIIRGR